MSNSRSAVIAAFALIALATLVPLPGDQWLHAFWCIRCGGGADPVELLLNVALFVPLGLALRASHTRASLALATIVATTIGVELLQYFVVVGRDGSIRDCISNTAGGTAAFFIQPAAGALWRADGRPSTKLAWGAAILWIAHAALASVLFRPAETSHRYFGQTAPRLAQFATFHGVVQDARVDGARVPDGPLGPDLEGVVRTREWLSLTARVWPGRPTENTAPIVAIADGDANEIAILAQHHTSVEFQSRVAAQNVGLFAPAVVLDDAIDWAGPSSGDAVTLEGLRVGYRLTLRASEPHRAGRIATLTLSPSLGWALWWRAGFPGRMTLWWATWVWLAAPVALMVFWSDAADASARWTRFLPAAMAVLGGEVIVPWLTGSGGFRWTEAGAAIVGLSVGIAASARARSNAAAVVAR